MKNINLGVLTLIALLSIGAGLAKVLQVPQEVEFMQAVGGSLGFIIVYGTLQILAGVFLVWPKTRLLGSLLACFGFMGSALLIFRSGNTIFALISLVPVLLTVFLIWQTVKELPKN